MSEIRIQLIGDLACLVVDEGFPLPLSVIKKIEITPEKILFFASLGCCRDTKHTPETFEQLKVIIRTHGQHTAALFHD